MNVEGIRRDYFPRWRNAHLWKVVEGHAAQWVGAEGKLVTSNENGYCDPVRRTIWVSDDSDATLIHEICHAVAAPNHGKRWRLRMAIALYTGVD